MLQKQRGFTFIEILIVMAILAILSLVALPKYNQIMASKKLFLAANHLLSDLREAQQIALNQETRVKITFFPNQKKTTDLYAIKVLEKNNYITLRSIYLPVGIHFVGTFRTDGVLTMLSTGKPDKNGSLKLENKNGEKLYVIIYQTGRFRISEKAP